MAKIATVITDYFEDVEYTDPAKAYKDAGHDVVTIGDETGKTVKGKQGDATVKIDKGIDEVSPADFDALFIPGGFSPDILRADDRFVSFAKHFMDEKKARICNLSWATAVNYREIVRRTWSDRL